MPIQDTFGHKDFNTGRTTAEPFDFDGRTDSICHGNDSERESRDRMSIGSGREVVECRDR